MSSVRARILIEKGPLLAVQDPDRVHVQLRCKHPDCGHYNSYPYREIDLEESQSIH